jgi:two-component system NtrC family sensor kinase
VYLKFKDSGTGIAQDIKEHIFEPFFTTKSIDKGTGLGLAIANEIVCKYGGRIAIESQPDKGSEFIVLLPNENLEHAQ